LSADATLGAATASTAVRASKAMFRMAHIIRVRTGMR
jgi:hypothetical protein